MMESSLAERGELNPGAGVPCIARHKCHTCERARSVRVRILNWCLGKLSLLLFIVLTSAATTFTYHKLWPHDVTSGAVTMTSSSRGEGRHEARHTGAGPRMDLQDPRIHITDEKTSGGGPAIAMSDQSSAMMAARLQLLYTNPVTSLTMTKEGSQFFTSGDVRVEDGGLVVERTTTLFLSADVILSSMASRGAGGPTTVVVCLALVRGDNPDQKPISCQLTYLRERDQQMARVWMLFQAQVNDRIHVRVSYPTYVISSSRDNRHSVFQAFEV